MKYYYIILLLIFVPMICEAQWIQVGQDINADEALDNLGSSVAISNDGNIIATGAFTSNTGSFDAGKVKVFQLQGNNWEQLGSDLLGEASEDEFGFSISLNGDGTKLAVGARFNDEGGSFAGQVTVYEYQGNDWVQIGQAINGDEGSILGYSVSLNESGDRVVVGIPEQWVNGIRVGQAKVFEYQNEQWIQIGDDINGSFEPVFFWRSSKYQCYWRYYFNCRLDSRKCWGFGIC